MKSKAWLKEHNEDPFVKRAIKEGWRSRAVYKLEEIDKKYNLIRQGMNIVDLGAAPGGWSQYVAKKVGKSGKMIAIDVLDMEAINNVHFIKGDFTEQNIYESLRELVGQNPIDLVLSDMAPNISGISSVDQPKAMYLAELAAEFSVEVLGPDGGLIVKLFQGAGFDDYVKMLRSKFSKVLIRKPDASRARSREMYALATHIKL
ncbi:MAG: 23S rRNA (uridine(2552)-2'-O)-methyltransferase RlmE [Gammaproteobacteria bacterium]